MGEATSAWRERLIAALQDPRVERLIRYGLVPALLVCSLWLPPVSLGVRLFHTDCPLITAKGGTVQESNGAQLAVAPGALSGRLRLRLRAVDPASKQASRGAVAQALKSVPAGLEVRGPLYQVEAYGTRPKEAGFKAPLPSGLSGPDALDLYAWTGKDWQFLPSRVTDGAQVQAALSSLPLLVAAMEAKPQTVAVGVDAPDGAAVNAAPLDLASKLYVAGLTLVEDGTVRGEVSLDTAPQQLLVLPILSNRVNGVARTDWVANIITRSEPRAAHIRAIVEAVSKGGYRGVSLEYEGLDTALKGYFSTFVAELADELHRAGKVLAVRIDPPTPAADGTWDTAGYDWAALGRAADLVRLPALRDPSAYAPGGTMEGYLREAVRQINRQKLELGLTASCFEEVGAQVRALCYGDALSLASKAVEAGEDNVVLPGETVDLRVANLASGLVEDPASGQLRFAFRDDTGAEHRVWIENSSSIERKLALAGRYLIRGVAVEDLAGTANDAQIWDVVRAAAGAAGRSASVASRGGSRYSVVWSVRTKDGELVEQAVSPADKPTFSWTAENPGDYIVSVAISEDGGKTTVGQPGNLEVLVPTPTPSPTPTRPPTPTPQPKPTAAPVSQPQTSPPPARTVGLPFDYGIQVDMVTDLNYDRILGSVQALGFRWIKQQVEWFRYNPAPGQYDWGRLDAIVDACSARGIKILFSVVKAPNWARPGDDDKSVAGPPADPNTYAEFMRQMAARYKGRVQAYEIWNEQNLWYEWGGHGHRLSAAKYVELLRAAYYAIKSVDPGAVVVSGALTPTGWNDGDTAIDDQVYLRQMYDAGLRSVCDAVGVHPSGYNNPPDADWRTWSDPTTSRGKGHPSWFFRSTMEGYRNIMIQYGDGSKRLIPTEFGWASVDGLGVPPARGYEYAADNTAQEQADFIVRAFQMGRNWGFVGPMFLWNLNFAPLCGPQDEKAAFGIVDPGWGPRPAFHALANMPK
ncbi:MAG: cellulase family glycosylhydrolase [Anaerolineae bacterium]|nr:cellulase family glycosylhydrolase [Anaerolineae bacterium]